MDELFEKFARGEMPNIIEVMQAISDLADFWPGDVCLDCRPRPDDDSTQPASSESILTG